MRIQTLPSSIARRIIIIKPPKFQVPFSSMADKSDPIFSQGEDEARLRAETASLLESKWNLDDARQGLNKKFTFPTYAKALVCHSFFLFIYSFTHLSASWDVWQHLLR